MNWCFLFMEDYKSKQARRKEESKEGVWKGLAGGEGREKRCDYIVISKIKTKVK